jgi:hypothetical protein
MDDLDSDLELDLSIGTLPEQNKDVYKHRQIEGNVPIWELWKGSGAKKSVRKKILLQFLPWLTAIDDLKSICLMGFQCS